MNGMTLELALKNELMTTVRLATGGVCSLAGLGLDDSEDCKVCVTESLLLLKHRGYLSAEIRYGYEDGFEISIEGKSVGGGKILSCGRRNLRCAVKRPGAECDDGEAERRTL